MDGRNFDELTRRLAKGASRRSLLKGMIGGGAALVGAKVAGTAAQPAAKVTLCHATSSDTNPWVMITVSENSKDLPAHMSHGDFAIAASTGAVGDSCCRNQDCKCSGQCAEAVCFGFDPDAEQSGTCQCNPLTEGTVCRAATDLCDVAEECDGVSLECPDDGVAEEGTLCREADGACDVDDYCDGLTKGCTDNVATQGTVCLAADPTKLCDVDDVCDGTSKTCTALVAEAGTVCRAAVDSQCDIAETCDGETADCPIDSTQPNGTACNADNSLCTQNDSCQAGVCTPGTAVICSAPDVCHAAGNCEASSGNCINQTLLAGYCYIDNTCYAAGDANPSNNCQRCDPSQSTDDWSNRPDGSGCGGGNGETCQAGACVCINPGGFSLGDECEASSECCSNCCVERGASQVCSAIGQNTVCL